MSNKNTIEFEVRDTTEKNPRELRRGGFVPATVYAKGEESISIQFPVKSLSMLSRLQKLNVFELKNEKKSFDAIIKQIQTLSTTDEILSVEFQKLKKDVKIKLPVVLNFVGTAEAVKAGGTFRKVNDVITVGCFPKDIPASLDVDISVLKTFDDRIVASNIGLPKGVELMTNGGTSIANIIAPRGSAGPAAEASA